MAPRNLREASSLSQFKNPHLIDTLSSYLIEIQNTYGPRTTILLERSQGGAPHVIPVVGVSYEPSEWTSIPILRELQKVAAGQFLRDQNHAIFAISHFRCVDHFLAIGVSIDDEWNNLFQYINPLVSRVSALLEYFTISNTLLDTVMSLTLADVYAMAMHESLNLLWGMWPELNEAFRQAEAGRTHMVRRHADSCRVTFDRINAALSVFRDAHHYGYQISRVSQVAEKVEAFAKAFSSYAFELECNIERAASRDSVSAVLEPVLNLLIYNSFQALSEARREPPDERRHGRASIHFRRGPKQSIIVTVKDDGPGIPEIAKPRIFDPLYSTKRRGGGLGLYLAKRVIESMGGSIRLASSIRGRGTEFVIRMPAKP